MKRLFQTLARKWPEYLLEMLVITLGILAAFGLNNWNEQRKDRKEEVKLLLSLRSDLLKNQKTAKEWIDTHTAQVISQRTLLEMINEQHPDIPADSAINLIAYGLMYQGAFRANDGAINSLLSSGKLSIIDSDSLNNMLTKWTTARNNYDAQSALIGRHVENEIKPWIYKNYPIRNFLIYDEQDSLEHWTDFLPLSKSNFEPNWSILLNSMEFENIIEIRRLDTQGQVYELRKLRSHEAQILDLINAELAELE